MAIKQGHYLYIFGTILIAVSENTAEAQCYSDEQATAYGAKVGGGYLAGRSDKFAKLCRCATGGTAEGIRKTGV